jgi:hypothetical protein
MIKTKYPKIVDLRTGEKYSLMQLTLNKNIHKQEVLGRFEIEIEVESISEDVKIRYFRKDGVIFSAEYTRHSKSRPRFRIIYARGKEVLV